MILAEDTRTSRKLLNHYHITTTMRAFHMHNEHRKFQEIGSKLTSGMQIALISDAGTPGISDPGFLLFRGIIPKYKSNLFAWANCHDSALVQMASL